MQPGCRFRRPCRVGLRLLLNCTPGKLEWMSRSVVCSLVFLTLLLPLRAEQPGAQQTEPGNPALHNRPATPPKTLVLREGKIKLDAVIRDAAGKPVTGLQPWEMKLLDNGRPVKILSFRSYDGILVKPNPQVEVFLVLDMVNLPFQQVAFVEGELEQFLREDGGRLAQPTTLITLTDTAVHVLSQPTLDGKALAKIVAGIPGNVRTIDSAQGYDGLLERAQYSIQQMEAIAENESQKPGRKLLVWLGWGWPILDRHADSFSEKDQQRMFDTVVELSTRLREARMAVFSLNMADSSPTYAELYRSFLNPVRGPADVDLGNLALKVLAVQSGGLILGPNNDLAGQIEQCYADANAFYTLSFDPPAVARADDYHGLTLQVDEPGVVVRTITDYYNQP